MMKKNMIVKENIWESEAVFEVFWETINDDDSILREWLKNEFIGSMKNFSRQNNHLVAIQLSDEIEDLLEKDYPTEYLEEELYSVVFHDEETAKTFDEMVCCLVDNGLSPWISFFLGRLLVNKAKFWFSEANDAFPV